MICIMGGRPHLAHEALISAAGEALRREGERVLAAFDSGEETDLLAILPGEYTADLEEVKAAIEPLCTRVDEITTAQEFE